MYVHTVFVGLYNNLEFRWPYLSQNKLYSTEYHLTVVSVLSLSSLFAHIDLLDPYLIIRCIFVC